MKESLREGKCTILGPIGWLGILVLCIEILFNKTTNPIGLSQ